MCPVKPNLGGEGVADMGQGGGGSANMGGGGSQRHPPSRLVIPRAEMLAPLWQRGGGWKVGRESLCNFVGSRWRVLLHLSSAWSMRRDILTAGVAEGWGWNEGEGDKEKHITCCLHMELSQRTVHDSLTKGFPYQAMGTSKALRAKYTSPWLCCYYPPPFFSLFQCDFPNSHGASPLGVTKNLWYRATCCKTKEQPLTDNLLDR